MTLIDLHALLKTPNFFLDSHGLDETGDKNDGTDSASIHRLFSNQIGSADIILLNKVDLLQGPSTIEGVRKRIASRLNAMAEIYEYVVARINNLGKHPYALVFFTGLHSPSSHSKHCWVWVRDDGRGGGSAIQRGVERGRMIMFMSWMIYPFK